MKNLLLILFLYCMGTSATAQSGSPRGYAKLVPDGSGGFKIKYVVDTISTTSRLNEKLTPVSAAFYQIDDSLLTFPDSDKPGDFYYGSLRNSFSQKNGLNISYYIRSNRYTGGALGSLMIETNHLVALVPPTDKAKRDSIIDREYRRYITIQTARNVLSNGDSCFSKSEAIVHVNHDRSMLYADSVAIIQYVLPTYGTCAVGLSKVVILYKNNIGYILLDYGLGRDMKRKISFDEASKLIDSLIKQTWGIIRFNKD